MPEKVWIRFEKKTKDGNVVKLRIQDLPPERIEEAMELRVKHFARDEIVHKAIGITKNPVAIEHYKEYLTMVMNSPENRTVICCEDNSEEVGDIMGVSGVTISEKDYDWEELLETYKQQNSTPEMIKLTELSKAVTDMYPPMKTLNLKKFLDDDSLLVLPDYRGWGIGYQFLKQRRLLCAELNVPKTGAWMTGYGTQKAAARGGWETVLEVKYEDLARDHDLVFEAAPPTMKYMLAGPLTSTTIDHQLNN